MRIHRLHDDVLHGHDDVHNCILHHGDVRDRDDHGLHGHDLRDRGHGRDDVHSSILRRDHDDVHVLHGRGLHDRGHDPRDLNGHCRDHVHNNILRHDHDDDVRVHVLHESSQPAQLTSLTQGSLHSPLHQELSHH